MKAEGMAAGRKQGPSRSLERPTLLPKWGRATGYTTLFLAAGQYRMGRDQGQKQRAHPVQWLWQ